MFKQYSERGNWASSFGDLTDEELIKQERTKLIHKLIKAPKDARILDAGAGMGKTIKVLNENGYGYVVGIDSSDELIDRANKIGICVLWSDVRKLKFANNSFDIYNSGGVLEHFSEIEQQQVLLEARRVLKPGGKAYFCIPWMRFRMPLLLIVRLFNWIRKTTGEPFHQCIYNEEDIRRIFTAAGFKLEGIHMNNKVKVIVEVTK